MAIRTSPQPAKYSAAKAFLHFNIANFVISAKVSNVINVAVQLQDARGQNITTAAHCRVYLSDNADGSTLTATVPTSNLAIGTNGLILASLVTNKYLQLISNATGAFDINITQTASPVTYYLVIQLPSGGQVVSGPITF